jgi:hypothetical protein
LCFIPKVQDGYYLNLKMRKESFAVDGAEAYIKNEGGNRAR